MRKIFQYILMAVAVVVTASCSNEIDETLHPAGNGALQFVVSDFPAFGESGQTRAIGTQDEGKTAWANEDKILIHLYSQKYGDQAVTLTFDAESNTWESDDASLSYLENETPTITAVYAPDCEIKSDETIGLLEGKKYGEEEYIPAKTSISGHTLDISFESGRTYSRLRIAAMPEATLTVTTAGFTPAGATSEATEAYTLTADEKGNAYLYGTFAEEATVSVKQGDIILKDYTFSTEKNPNGTEHNKSYALDARPVIDGTLGGKATAEESDIIALVDQLKDYVANGNTTIIVTGETPATIEVDGYTIPAIGETLYRMRNDDSYNGKIDLILQDVTEIADQGFYYAYALNSITLPKVTTVGDEAFQGCDYMKQITFGSVVTSIVQENGLTFHVGDKVDGCDLVLNCGQMQTEDTYKPDLENNVWFKSTWKSITLTHTGDCDECKANQ